MPEIEYSTIQISVKMQLYFQNGITFVLFLKNKKAVMVNGNICIWLWVINYLCKLPCSFMYKSPSVSATETPFTPNSGDTQRMHSCALKFLLLSKDNTVSKE